MKKRYKVIIIVLVVIAALVASAVFLLKRGKKEPIFNDQIKHDLAVADFKEGEEYQFGQIPWGISLKELKKNVPYSLFEDPIRPTTDFHSTESYLLLGKTTDAIFKFEEEKLAEVQLVFRSEENAVEQFESIVTEATELFGAESEKIEDTITIALGYIWKTDNTMLEITTYKVGDRKVMNIFVRAITESESTGNVTNNEETANNETSNETQSNENTEGLIEFKLADLKQGDEYQIDLVPLGSSWYELRPWAAFDGYVIISPDENGEFSYSDIRKFVGDNDECLLEGKRFNAVYEFFHDELVDVKLVFRSEKNIAEQFAPFVAELTKLFGPETSKTENSETGGLTYTWQTDNTRLQIDLEVLNDTTKDMTLSIGYTEKERDRIQTENVKENRELLLTGFKQDQGYQFENVEWYGSGPHESYRDRKTGARIAKHEMTVDELLPILLEDKDFYENSGGGVTLSGGECLMQAEFCAELLKNLKENNIHTAVDTCGFVSKEAFDKVMPYTDIFLYDLKAFDEDVHIKGTGQSNKVILKNLKYLDSCGKKIEIRIPYVPEFNDNQLPKIAEFLSKFQNITKVRVLPYHNYASSKYAALNIKNTLPEILPTNNEIIAAETYVREQGLTI